MLSDAVRSAGVATAITVGHDTVRKMRRSLARGRLASTALRCLSLPAFSSRGDSCCALRSAPSQ